MQPTSNTSPDTSFSAGQPFYPKTSDNDNGFLPPKDDITPAEAVERGEIGQSGTLISMGFISGEEYNALLVGRRGWKKYDEMRRSDATVHASLEIIKLPLLAAEWNIQPASDDPIDVAQAEFVKENIFNRVRWRALLREILTMADFGFSVFEKVHTIADWGGYVDVQHVDVTPDTPPPTPQPTTPAIAMTDPATGQPKVMPPAPTPPPPPTKKVFKDVETQILPAGEYVMLDKIASRKQTSILRWQTADNKAGIQQLTNMGGNFSIPMEKLVIFTHQQEGDNYEGISVLRTAYKHWYLKDVLYKVQAIAIERQGVGIPFVKPPENASEDSRQQARSALRELRSQEKGYLEFPQGFDFGFLDMNAHTTMDADPAIMHHDRQIMKNVLAQFLELGSGSKGGGGSHALSADQSRLFEQCLEEIAAQIEEIVNDNIIKQLIDYNFTVGKNGYPTLEHGKIADDNIQTVATAVAQLATANMLTPDPDLEQAFRDMMHLPDLPQEYRDDYDNRPMALTTANPPTAQMDNDLPDTGGAEDMINEDDIVDLTGVKVDATDQAVIRDLIDFNRKIDAHERRIKYVKAQPKHVTVT